MDVKILISLFFISFVTSFMFNIIFRSIAKKNKILIDLPDKSRKFHKRPTPLTGGISIFLGSIISIYVSNNLGVFDSTVTLYDFSIITACSLIVVIFLLDDFFSIGANFRLITQVLICILLVLLSDIYLVELGNLFGFGEWHLGIFGPAFTVFCAVGIMNAFNMIDGVNGLCSGLSVIVILMLGVFHYGFQETHLIFLFGAISSFLIFNLGVIGKKRWVFLGDHGSNLLGFLIAFSLIGASQEPVYNFSPVTALWYVAIPLLDCLGLITKRLYRGDGPFQPDRDHLHHRLMASGYSSKNTMFIIIVIALCTALIGYFLQILTNDFVSFYCFAIYAAIFYYCSHIVNLKDV